MPLPGAKFRVKTTPKGEKIRLAFLKGKVVEAVKMPKAGGKLKARMTGGHSGH